MSSQRASCGSPGIACVGRRTLAWELLERGDRLRFDLGQARARRAAATLRVPAEPGALLPGAQCSRRPSAIRYRRPDGSRTWWSRLHRPTTLIAHQASHCPRRLPPRSPAAAPSMTGKAPSAGVMHTLLPTRARNLPSFGLADHDRSAGRTSIDARDDSNSISATLDARTSTMFRRCLVSVSSPRNSTAHAQPYAGR